MRKVKHLYYDLVVAGGGLAGVCCAISAARKGLRTALVQDRPVLGGNSSSEIRVPPSGSVEKNAWSMETGLVEEIILKDRASNYNTTFTGYVNSMYDLCLLDMVKAEDNIALFLNTAIRSADVLDYGKGSKLISTLYAVQLSSGQDYAMHAGQFADCTGDGEIGYIAGAEYQYGRESRGTYNENLAPVVADNEVMGATILFLARNIGKPVEFIAPSWAKKIRTAEDIGFKRGIGTLSQDTGNVHGGYWWVEIGAPYHQVHKSEQVKDELLANVMGVWNYIKNYSVQKENAVNYALEWIGTIPGKRESRRLLGDIVVTEQDCHRDAEWADRIAYAGWFLDTHITGGMLNKVAPPEPSYTDENYKQYTLVPPYTIPLRACYSKNVNNLWMAGRDISVSHVALSSVRLQCTLANIGQAVGVAAAYAAKQGISPREAAKSPNIQEIQQDIIKDDVHIPGIRNSDENDLALNARVMSSSEQLLYFGEPNYTVFEKLDRPRAQVFPVTHESVDTIEVFLKNETSENKNVTAIFSEISRIWDQDDGKPIKVCKSVISAGYCGWIVIPIFSAVRSGKPHRISLGKENGISWAHSTHQPTGTTAQYQHDCSGGPDPANKDLPYLKEDQIYIPEYKVWNNYGWRKGFSFAIRVTPVPAPYSGSNVNNGYSWPLDMPNLWISEYSASLPQYVVLDFGDPIEFNTVMISFDTNLNLLHTYMPGQWRSPVCAKEWRLYAKMESGWSLIYSEDNNYQRRRTVRVNKIKAEALKLEIIRTNAGKGSRFGENSARVYEIRVYND